MFGDDVYTEKDIVEAIRNAETKAEEKLMKVIIKRIRRLAKKRNPNKELGVGLHLDIHDYSEAIIQDLQKIKK